MTPTPAGTPGDQSWTPAADWQPHQGSAAPTWSPTPPESDVPHPVSTSPFEPFRPPAEALYAPEAPAIPAQAGNQPVFLPADIPPPGLAPLDPAPATVPQTPLALTPRPYTPQRDRWWTPGRIALLFLVVLLFAALGFGLSLIQSARSLAERQDEVATDLTVRAALTAAGTAVGRYAAGTLSYPETAKEAGYSEVKGIDVQIVGTWGNPMNGDPVDFCLSGARTGEAPILWFKSGAGITATPCANAQVPADTQPRNNT